MKIKIAIIIVFIIFSGCKKTIFDYRHKYLGDYDFVVHKTSWTLYSPQTNTDTTYNYRGKISYGPNENTLRINYSENQYYEPVIDKNGSLGNYGQFDSKTKITFSTHSGGLGGGYTCNFTGNKVK